MSRLILITLLLVSSVSAQDVMKWWADFSKAVEADDYLAQRELVKKHRSQIFNYFRTIEIQWCKLKNDSDPASQEMADKTFEALFQLSTVNQIENRDKYLVRRVAWLKGLNADQRKAKIEHWDLLGQGWPLYQKARKERTQGAVDAARPYFDKMLAKALEASDHFWIVNGYLAIGECYEILFQHFEAYYYYRKAANAVREGGLRDNRAVARYDIPGKLRKAEQSGNIRTALVDVRLPLAEAKAKYEADAAAPPDAKGGEGKDPKSAGTKGNPETDPDLPPIPNKHEGKKEWEEFKGFKLKSFPKGLGVLSAYWKNNAHWWFWPEILLAKNEEKSTTILPGQNKIKNDKGKVFLTQAGLKKPVRLKVGSRPKTQKFTKVRYGDESKGKVWHVLMTQPNTYTFNGFKMRSLPGVILKIKGATGVVGTLKGHPFTIYDSDASGTFDTWGKDTMVLGKGKAAHALPLSSEILLDGKLYHLRVSPDGRTVGLKPYTDVLAPLKLEWKGEVKPAFIIAQRDDDSQQSFINLMEAHNRFIWVRPGNYILTEGYIIKGRGDKAKTIEITPPPSRKTFSVSVGTKNVWKMGGAGEGFHFRCKPKVVNHRGKIFVTIEPGALTVVGAFGEVYKRSLFGVGTPKIWIRKGKNGPIWCNGKKTKKPGRSDLNTGQENMFNPKLFKWPKGSSGAYSIKAEGKIPGLGLVKMDWTLFE